jgi:hypothetical protein
MDGCDGTACTCTCMRGMAIEVRGRDIAVAKWIKRKKQ